MGEKVPQTLKNHVRFDPMYHFVTMPLAIAFWIWTIVHLFRHPGREALAWLVVATLIFLLVGLVRSYSLKVQDRVIRLEETLRLAQLSGSSAIPTLTEGQLIALRFASDAEMPALAQKASAGNLKPKEIKQAVQTWRPDYFRV
jgi:hypothetical protein